MHSSKNGTWSTRRRFVMAFLCPVLLLLLGAHVSAQTVTVTPDSVDPAKRPPVVLSVTKADGSNDSALISRVKSVKVGDKTVPFKADAQGGSRLLRPN
jgi:hypothetical protein